ncbi:alpha-amylase family glycosyl hydrolase, partial [Streptomyces zhihengii]
LSPVYPSPHDDNGYDISDYQDIDPLFGTLDDRGPERLRCRRPAGPRAADGGRGAARRRPGRRAPRGTRRAHRCGRPPG